jgi:hypothetical protein
VESEGEGSIVRPTFLVEDKAAIARAKKNALEQLGPELVRHLRSLHTGLSAANRVEALSRPTAPVFRTPTTPNAARADLRGTAIRITSP